VALSPDPRQDAGVTPSRDLDFTPLARSMGLGARLKTAAADHRLVIAGTIGVLLLVVSMAVLVGLLATGNATDVGGLLVLVMCLGAGAYVLFDVLRQSGGAGTFGEFARANDLLMVRGSMVPHYGGSLFADGTHAVLHSVRTRDELFVEVGDRFPTTAPERRSPNQPRLFLRTRLPGRVTGPASEAVSPALRDALRRFAGDYLLEGSGDELTVFGSRALEPGRPGRVQEAFVLVEELAAQVTATVDPGSGSRTPAGVRPEPLAGRRPRPLAVAGWTLALVVGGPVAIAIVMSTLDEHLRGNEGAARVVVSLIILVVLAAVGRLLKAAMTVRRADRTPER
jgi:hypothetical protein